MSVVRKLPNSAAEHADEKLEIAIAALRDYANYTSRFVFLDGGHERAQQAFALGVELNKLRRPEVVARLDAERLARVRSA